MTDADAFADLLAANRRYAATAPKGFDGIAHAGVAVVTCMDSRIQPLDMIGLFKGEAKILRTPGGHVTHDALAGCILGVHLLQVTRILVVQHTRCAAASTDNAGMRSKVLAASGLEAGDFDFGADPDQVGRLVSDVDLLRTHPLLAGQVRVGGFMYDVDSGLIEQLI
ncbi:MAG: beta-class carbonic anhydrase [Propioniciclava sp.]